MSVRIFNIYDETIREGAFSSVRECVETAACSLQKANLREADLRGADLEKAFLERTSTLRRDDYE